MSGIARASVTLVLLVSFGTLPIAMDWCAASCESRRTSRDTTFAPACHHADSSSARIDRVPTPCSHDHHGALVIASEASQTFASRTLISTAAIVVGPHVTTVRVVQMVQRAGPAFGPPTGLIPLALSSALRI